MPACSVKPSAASAKMAEVTRAKPIEAINTDTGYSPKWSATELYQESRAERVKAALELTTGEAPSERPGPCA